MTFTKRSTDLWEIFQEFVKDSPGQALKFNVNVNINIRAVYLGLAKN